MTKTYGRLVIAALAWGVLSFGAVYPWAYWPLAAGCAALGIWGIGATRAWQDPRTRALGLALAAVALAIALQLVSLPYAVVGAISPGVDRFLREYQIAYHPAALHPLSIAPGLTAVSLALFCAFALFAVGLVRAIRFVRLDWLLIQLMGLGVGLAVLGVVQKGFIDEARPLVYGFWKPQQGGNPFGPFINRNHFAGWMVMALPVVIGYSCAVAEEARRSAGHHGKRWLRWIFTVEANKFLLVAFVVLAMGMSLAMTGSRSGVASFAVAIGVFGFFLLRRVGARRVRTLAAVYLFVLLAGAVAWAGVDVTVNRFERATSDAGGRLAAWRDTREIVKDFPVFGTGVGTYGRAMLLYQTEGRDVMYAQAHNDYIQILAEGGLLVGVPALVVAGLVLFGMRRRLGSGEDDRLTGWIRIGAVAALAGIAAQSFVEFSLQMPGNRVLFALLVALALHRPARRSPDANRV